MKIIAKKKVHKKTTIDVISNQPAEYQTRQDQQKMVLNKGSCLM